MNTGACDLVPDLYDCTNGHNALEPNEDCPWCTPETFERLLQQGTRFFTQRLDVIEQPEGTAAAHVSVDAEEDVHQTVQFIPEGVFTLSPFQPLSKRSTKGKRQHKSKSVRAKKKSDYTARLPMLIEKVRAKSVAFKAQTPHDVFRKRPQSQKAGRDIVEASFQTEPEDLPSYPTHQNVFVRANPKYERPGDPKFLLAAWANALPDATQTQLYEAMVELEEAKYKTHERASNRDATPQAHCGIWHIRGAEPRMTSDTLHQPPKAQEPLKKLLNLLRTEVCPIIWRLLDKYDPITLKRQQKVAEYVRSNSTLMAELNKMPWVDFAGVFFTVAIKRGGSQILHLDWNDHPSSYAWVIPVGPGWTGGDICFPQLGKKLPTYPGQIIAFRARYLAHKASPCEGNRVVFTGFTDYVLMGKALKAT